MYKITLEWSESDRVKSLTFTPNQVTKNPGTIRIGREQEKCDLVLPETEKTVSRLHGEIFFNSETKTFYVRNLTKDQPPNKQNHIMVDSQKVIDQEVAIGNGSLIQVGKIVLKVSLETIHPELPQPDPHRIRCTNGHILDYKYLNSFCPYCGVAVTGGTVVIKQ
ncbi:hypothetical protein BCD67_04040 [Oscillatoriales cyanobacterium USR001]|nr:hypothetical protein BCD67_04040 [Oscillatoriales cyanobacterium USR001]